MGALGKCIRDNGFEEILVKSKVCPSGSMEKVITCKHYNRALRVHTLVLESLLFQAFESCDDLSKEIKAVLTRLVEDPFTETLNESLTNNSCIKLLSVFHEFKRIIRLGEFSKTAQLWLNYMDRAWRIPQIQKTTKETT